MFDAQGLFITEELIWIKPDLLFDMIPLAPANLPGVLSNLCEAHILALTLLCALFCDSEFEFDLCELFYGWNGLVGQILPMLL